MDNCPIYKRYEYTLSDSGHQHIIEKTFHNLYSIEDPTAYSTYNTDKNLVFSESDQVLAKTTFHGKLGDYEIIKNERSNYLGIDSHQRGQYSKNMCCHCKE